MATNQRIIQADITLNLEGQWPRSTYRRMCAERGVAYTEQDYLHWRAVGERLTGQPCFETQIDRASKAFTQLGMTASKAGTAAAAIYRKARQR